VDELYQARRLIEPAVARLAVEQHAAGAAGRLGGESAVEDVTTRLANNVSRTERALAEGAAVSALNREFHAILAEHAGNRVLALMMQALREMLETQDERYPNTPAVSRCALREHQQVLAALRAGDGDAAERLMRQHLTQLEGRVRRLSSQQRRRSTAMVRSLPDRRQQRVMGTNRHSAKESEPG
jgi:DNA-binding FadR family transcriptional regulator